MFVLFLFTCVVMGAFSAQAKVVTSFDECKEFFYNGTEPRGMDQNAVKICQKMQQKKGFSFATLYSVPHRIPLYSAYTFDRACLTPVTRRDIWYIEPQISNPSSQTDYMVRETKIPRTSKDIKQFQATSSHYIGTGYDRGHLNPNCFGREATFTLTNAVPMDACFNRIYWKSWEIKLKTFLKTKIKNDGNLTTVYIVTGAVPDRNVRIPQFSEDPEKVTVPSHIWTAVCYLHLNDEEKSLSFGYIGKNQPSQPDINIMSISDLNAKLSKLYSEVSGSDQSITVFADDCFGDNNKLSVVYKSFKKLIHLPVNMGIQMSTDIQNTYNAVKRKVNNDNVNNDNGTPERRSKIQKLAVQLGFDSMNTYYTEVEDLKISDGSACLIISAKPQTPVNDEYRKRDVSEVLNAVECLMVPEKQMTAADGSKCSSITNSDDSCDCDAGGTTKPCCSSPCLYRDKLNSYRCYSGQKLIKCSPRYSLITAKGKKCLDDHPCATYGKDYYWCKTSSGWDYCSPPLRQSKAKDGKYCRNNHACAKYGSNYRWCYTDDKNNDKCCISEDCNSTVTEKRCRQDHPCGYHDGTNYLWCYTDYKNNYEYCCTECDDNGNIL
ncbi:uncharacterized protein [Paramisgurnus dabryanus]|uniref:uncharacterized protein n=1 Tax=Paramisgurnus dabryanus TaxID=90735 RepID=UPI0031F39E8A